MPTATLTTPQSQQDAEALQMLGAAPAPRIPAITAGSLVLLDIIRSPLLTGAPPSTLDILRALYILTNGPQAATPIMSAVRRFEALAEAAPAPDATPETYAVYLESLSRSADAWGDLDTAVAEFAETLGPDPIALGAALGNALTEAAAGFSIIPSARGGIPSKKNLSAPSGWREWPRKFARWCRG